MDGNTRNGVVGRKGREGGGENSATWGRCGGGLGQERFEADHFIKARPLGSIKFEDPMGF